MADLTSRNQKLLAACSSGDTEVLEVLLNEHKADSEGVPTSTSTKERPLRTTILFETAIEGQQLEILDILSKYYPGSSMYGGPVLTALRTGSPKVLAAVCKIDTEVANCEVGDDSSLTALGEACSNPNSAELVKVLLDAGADPNLIPPFRLPGCWNVSAAVNRGLPASTFEQLFDAGYDAYDAYAVELAVQQRRSDVLEVMIKRGDGLPNARFPPKQDLIKVAEANKDPAMVALIQRAYPVPRGKSRGFFATLVSEFRS